MTADVATPSAERSAMDQSLELIADIRAGGEAIRGRSSRYLPKYQKETDDDYRRRVSAAPWRPEFVDTLRSLASKPFAQDVLVADDTPPEIRALADDIDGRGNNLTRFAHQAFTEGLANGVHAILVDYTQIHSNASRADEIALGARPYWTHIPVTSIVALRIERVRGRDVVTHLRYRAGRNAFDGFQEKVVEQIHVREPGLWTVWEKNASGVWEIASTGEIRIAGKVPSEVPLALFFTGQRIGDLQTRSALQDLAEVQIELFRALSRQDEILTYTGSPMLAANGVSAPGPEAAPIVLGPKSILFAPGDHAKWGYISPDAAAIGEVRKHVESVEAAMHRLGMQPSMPMSGSITATASAVNAAKAHSAVEAWATALKDCLEHAFWFTAQWVGSSHETVVQVFSDFAVGDQNSDEAALLLDATEAGVISGRTMREELRRRNILSPGFDPDKEARRLSDERRRAAGPVTPDPLPVPVSTPARRRTARKPAAA